MLEQLRFAFVALLVCCALCAQSSPENVGSKRTFSQMTCETENAPTMSDLTTETLHMLQLPNDARNFVGAALQRYRTDFRFEQLAPITTNKLLFGFLRVSFLEGHSGVERYGPMVIRSLLREHHADLAFSLSSDTTLFEMAMRPWNNHEGVLPVLREVLEYCKDTNQLHIVEVLNIITTSLALDGHWDTLALISTYTCRFNATEILVYSPINENNIAACLEIVRCVPEDTLSRILSFPESMFENENATDLLAGEARRRGMDMEAIASTRNEHTARMFIRKDTPAYSYEDMHEALDAIMRIPCPSPIHYDIIELKSELGVQTWIDVLVSVACNAAQDVFDLFNSKGLVTNTYAMEAVLQLHELGGFVPMSFMLSQDPNATWLEAFSVQSENRRNNLAQHLIDGIFRAGNYRGMNVLTATQGKWSNVFMALNFFRYMDFGIEASSYRADILMREILVHARDSPNYTGVFEVLTRAQTLATELFRKEMRFPVLLAKVLRSNSDDSVCHFAQVAATEGNWRFFEDLYSLRGTRYEHYVRTFVGTCMANVLGLASDNQTFITIMRVFD